MWPLRRGGGWRCIWKGAPQKSPAFSAAPAPSVAASSAQRDRAESPQADLRLMEAGTHKQEGNKIS